MPILVSHAVHNVYLWFIVTKKQAAQEYFFSRTEWIIFIILSSHYLLLMSLANGTTCSVSEKRTDASTVPKQNFGCLHCIVQCVGIEDDIEYWLETLIFERAVGALRDGHLK